MLEGRCVSWTNEQFSLDGRHASTEADPSKLTLHRALPLLLDDLYIGSRFQPLQRSHSQGITYNSACISEITPL